MKLLTHRPHDGSRVPRDVILLALIDHDLCRDAGEVRVQGSDGEDHRTMRKLPKGELGCSARSCVHARMDVEDVTRPSMSTSKVTFAAVTTIGAYRRQSDACSSPCLPPRKKGAHRSGLPSAHYRAFVTRSRGR
jgi:hypothetical protein